MNNQNVQPSAETAEGGLVSALRMSLSPFGLERVLDGLDNNADINQVMRRLLEIRGGLGADGKKPEPTLAEFQAIVAASCVLPGKHSAFLLAQVRQYTIVESKYRMIALEALSSVCPASKAVFEQERREQIEQLRKSESVKFRGCCEGHNS